MKVALIGGTGKLGRGLAVRLSGAHDILIGSRSSDKGRQAAEKLEAITRRRIIGGTNEDVARPCDAAVLTLPSLDDLVVLQGLKNLLKTKLVISPIVPMQIQNGVFRYSKAAGSAAEEVASALSESRVVAAFHNLPAAALEEQDHILDFDVLVACENREDYYQASRLIGSIEGLRPLYVGSLAMSRQIEALTPLLLNVGRMNGLRRLSFKFVS